MSELAFNINGEAFEVPAQATGWRVRRMRAKGSPEVVYGRDGLPLVLQIDADLDDLRCEVDVTGRYRLDLVDQHNKAITDVPSGYVQINTQQAPSGGSAAPANAPQVHSDHPMVEAMRINADLAKTVVDRFPQMMEAAAVLLRAADGAGLPRRSNLLAELAEVDGSDDDAEESGNEASPTIELINSLVAQVIPIVVTSLTSGKKLPKLASVLDWRKAAPKASNEDSSEPAADASEQATPAALDPAMMARVIAIQSALAPAEAARARQLAAELSPSEVQAWFRELAELSTDEAVAKIRSIINRTSKGGAQ